MCLAASGGAVGNVDNPEPEGEDAIFFDCCSIFIFLIKLFAAPRPKAQHFFYSGLVAGKITHFVEKNSEKSCFSDNLLYFCCE